MLALATLQGMLLCGVGSRLMAFNYRDGALTASGFLVCGFLVRWILGLCYLFITPMSFTASDFLVCAILVRWIPPLGLARQPPLASCAASWSAASP